ncbi:MAG: aspartyl protease family protein [Bacteroidales bacterium]|nr:aspartyl protease family protein [Bacteroidales bacterium]
MNSKEIQLVEIPLECLALDGDDNFYFTVKGGINDKPVRLLVDTGATKSCIRKGIIRRTANTVVSTIDKVVGFNSEKSDNKMLKAKTFFMGEFIVHNYHFLEISLVHVNRYLKMLEKECIDGIIGNDILYSHAAIINYKKSTLTLKTQKSLIINKIEE